LQNAENVIVDTSIWIDYLRGTDASLRNAVAFLVRSGRVSICGVVLAELLAGARTARDQERVDTLFRGLPYLEFSRSIWTSAGQLAANLRAQGITLPFADLLLAAIALEHGHTVFTHDVHFQHIANLRLYQPV